MGFDNTIWYFILDQTCLFFCADCMWIWRGDRQTWGTISYFFRYNTILELLLISLISRIYQRSDKEGDITHGSKGLVQCKQEMFMKAFWELSVNYLPICFIFSGVCDDKAKVAYKEVLSVISAKEDGGTYKCISVNSYNCRWNKPERKQKKE